MRNKNNISLLNNFKGFACLAFVFLMNVANAEENQKWYQQEKFLEGGFNISQYQKCEKLYKSCPKDDNDMFLDEKCVNKYLDNEKSCAQTKKLLTLIDYKIDGLEVKKLNNFSLINAVTLADGIVTYYIITPAGYIVDTSKYPQKNNLPISFKNQPEYKHGYNWNEPVLQSKSKKNQVVTSLLNIRDCVGCETNYCLSVNLTFSKDGKPITVQSEVKNDKSLCEYQNDKEEQEVKKDINSKD